MIVFLLGCSLHERTLERAKQQEGNAGTVAATLGGKSAGSESISKLSSDGGQRSSSSTNQALSTASINQGGGQNRSIQSGGTVAIGGSEVASSNQGGEALVVTPSGGSGSLGGATVAVSATSEVASTGGSTAAASSSPQGGQSSISVGGTISSGGTRVGSAGTAGVAGVPEQGNPPIASCIEASIYPSCGECMDNACPTQYRGCHANADCAALLTCIANCLGGLTCITECQTRYASVLPLAEAVFDCADTACKTQCAPVGDAITDYAQAYCGKMRECAPGQLAIVFRSYEDCVLRTRMQKTWVGCLPGTTANEVFYRQCAAGWADRDCADYFGPEPAACWKSGVFTDGRTCNANEQCESTFCKQQAWSCGVCAPSPAVGTQCTTTWGQCGRDQWCTDAGTCEYPRELGRSCSDLEAPCRNDLMCDNGTCVAAPNTVGANCDVFNGNFCNWAQGFACSMRTNQCANMGLANAGESCGNIGDGYVACADGGSCSTGKCVARPVDHGSCDPAADLCKVPAMCSSTGTCMLPMDTPICE